MKKTPTTKKAVTKKEKPATAKIVKKPSAKKAPEKKRVLTAAGYTRMLKAQKGKK